jgi:hypothetical protein
LAVLYLAREALWVPLGVECSDEALHDGLVTAFATRSIVFIVALTTERLSILLMETIRAKLLTTQGAEEMLRVPCLVQGTHHPLQGGGDRGHGLISRAGDGVNLLIFRNGVGMSCDGGEYVIQGSRDG